MISHRTLLHNSEKLLLDLKKRQCSEEFINKVILSISNLKKLKDLEKQQQEFQATKKILVKEGEKSKDKVIVLNEKIDNIERDINTLENNLNEVLPYIPNLLSDEVPEGVDEKDNVVIKVHGPTNKNSLEHYNMGLIDSAGEMTSARFVLLKGQIATLERALGNFLINFLIGRGFTEVSIPHMLNENSLYLTGHMPKDKENMFYIPDKNLYLIPTSECVLLNIMANKTITNKEIDTLPLKYTAFNVNFRKEAGAAGKDTKGLIRLHQFPKVEMVCFTKEEDSERVFNEMVNNGEEALKLLGLSYRILNLSSGDLNFNGSICYDLEVWMAGTGEYREVSSVSNCRDFQSNGLKCKYVDENGEKKLLHTLNGTCLGVGRIVAAIMEEYYDEKASIIKIPEVLIPYTNFSFMKIKN
jgi:seryl-tRNA synthetase